MALQMKTGRSNKTFDYYQVTYATMQELVDAHPLCLAMDGVDSMITLQQKNADGFGWMVGDGDYLAITGECSVFFYTRDEFEERYSEVL